MSDFTEFDSFERIGRWEWWLGRQPKYELTKDLHWELHFKDSGKWLHIDAGTQFDISVPWYFWWFLSPNNRRYLLAAVVHDEILIRGFDPAFAAFEFMKAMRARAHNDWRIKPSLMGVIFHTV